MLLLAVGICLVMAAATSVTTFFVDYAVSRGVSEAIAGYGLAAASLGTVLVRVLAGSRADRMVASHLVLCGSLVLIGALGFVLLAFAGPKAFIFLGALIALPAGWGSNGVFWYALTNANPDRPGAATGIVRPGSLLGGSLGPLAMGLVIGHASYRVAWTIVALMCLLAAGTMFAAHARLNNGQGPRSAIG
jgi:MFS family permease